MNRPVRRLAGAAGLTMVGLVVVGSVRAAARIAAGAAFGPEAVGYVTAALAVATIVTIVGPSGLAAGITKFLSELLGAGRDRDGRRFSGLAARTGVGFAAGGAVAGVAYSAFDATLAASGAAGVAVTGALVLVFGAYQTGKAIAYGEGAIGRYVRLELAGAAAFGLALAAVWFGGREELIVLPLVAAYVPVALIAAGRLGAGGPRTGLPVREFAGYGVLGALGSLAGIGFTAVTPLVAGYLDRALGAALIGAVLTITEPLYLAPRAISLVLLPRLSFDRAAGRLSEAAAGLRAATTAAVVLVAPVCAVLVLERDRLLQVFFPDELVGGPTLAWFSLAVFLSVAGAPAVTALAATRLRDLSVSVWSSLAGFALAAGVWAVGASHGTVAVAAGYAAGSLIQILAPLVVATRRYGVTWGWFWARAAAGMAVVAALLPAAPSLLVDAGALLAVAGLLLPELRSLLALVRRQPAGTR